MAKKLKTNKKMLLNNFHLKRRIYPFSRLNFRDRRMYLFHQGGSITIKSYALAKLAGSTLKASILKKRHFGGIM